MKRILAMARKDLTLLVRDRVGFFFVFFFPLVYAIFFGTIFAGAGEGDGMGAMKIAVVDEDGTDASAAFARRLAEADELDTAPATRAEAEDLVRRGRRAAYVILPAGFGDSSDRLLQGGGLRLEAGLDPARKAESGMLQGLLTQYAFEVLQDLFTDRRAMRRQIQSTLDTVRTDGEIPTLTRAVLDRFLVELDTFMADLPEEEEETGGEGGGFEGWNPIRIEFNSITRQRGVLPKTSFDITMPQAFVWMFFGCSAAFAVSLVTERTRGTLMRLRSAPVTLTQILAGKALACFTTTITALVALYLFFNLVFGVRPDSLSLLALAFVCSSIAFVGVMMLISVMGKTEAAVGGIGWAFLIVMAMLGGGMLPLFFMPSWMQTVSNFSFVKWTVLAVEGAVWRGFTLSEMMLPCGILLGIGAVCFVVGVRIFKATAD